MSKGKGLWLVGFLMLGCVQLNAQSFSETALLFSRTIPGGSARIQSLGGSQVALGGDISSALSNPAGLGMYNKSEFTISPAVRFAKSSATYFGVTTQDSKSTFHIPGFSLAFHNDYDKLQGFLGGTFSIAYTRINDFNNNLSYGAGGLNTSIIDSFLENANGFPVSQFDSGGELRNTPTHLGYENYLIGDSTVIDPNANPNAYFTDALGIPSQTEEIQTRGAQNQWSFAYGTNFNDRLFIGAGIGVTTIKYKSVKKYNEGFTTTPLFNLTLDETLEIRGSGVNANFGVMYRPLDFVQIALSGTSPTYYELSDSYYAFMSTVWDDFQYDANTILSDVQYTSDVVNSDYSLTTPGKLNAGVTFFLKKYGFLTIDAERVNYAKAKYNAVTQGISFDSDNQEIQSLYQVTYNFRTGLEIRLKSFRFRGGFAYLPQPYKKTQNDVSTKLRRITGGVGYREKNFYFDLAIVHSYGDDSYRPYVVNSIDTPLLTYTQRSTNVLFTLGFPF